MNLVYLTLMLLTAFGPPEAVLPKAQDALPSSLTLDLVDSFRTVSQQACSLISARARADLATGTVTDDARMVSYNPDLTDHAPDDDTRFYTLLVSEQELAQAALGGHRRLTWPGHVVVYQSEAPATAPNPIDGTFEIDSPKGILYCNEDTDSRFLRLKAPRLVLARAPGASDLIAADCDRTCRSNTVVDELAHARALLMQILRQATRVHPHQDFPAVDTEGTLTAHAH